MPVRRAISVCDSPFARRPRINSVVALMRQLYASSHSPAMPKRIIRRCIVPNVKPYKLIHRLVQEAGGSLPVAKAMRKPGFQGTLHKIAAGLVTEPSRTSAERIARHFGIPLEAIYDERIAAQVAAERFGAEDSSAPPEETNIPEVTITDWKPGDPFPRTTGELMVCDEQLLTDLYELLPEEQEALRAELHERAERLRRHSEIVLKKAGVRAVAPRSHGVGNAIPLAPGGVERRTAPAPVATERRVHEFVYAASAGPNVRDIASAPPPQRMGDKKLSAPFQLTRPAGPRGDRKLSAPFELGKPAAPARKTQRKKKG